MTRRGPALTQSAQGTVDFLALAHALLRDPEERNEDEAHLARHKNENKGVDIDRIRQVQTAETLLPAHRIRAA
jgi:hypothetical protein